MGNHGREARGTGGITAPAKIWSDQELYLGHVFWINVAMSILMIHLPCMTDDSIQTT